MEMKMPVHVMKRGGNPEEASWRARVTGNPLRDAFDPKIMTHAGMSASLVPEEELSVRIEEIADTVRGRRTVAYTVSSISSLTATRRKAARSRIS